MFQNFFLTNRGSAFSPGNLPNLALWMDASDVSTLNGGSITNGAGVSAWVDKSPNALTYSQATSGKRPIWNSSVYNGKPAITFSQASTQVLDGGATVSLVDPSTPFSLVIVMAKIGALGTFQSIFNFYNSTSANNAINFTNIPAGDRVEIGAGASNFNPGVGFTPTAFTTLSAIQIDFDGSGSAVGNWAAYQDNSAPMSLTAAAAGSADNKNLIGAALASGLFSWNGTMVEIVLVSGRSLSSQERSQLQTYFQDKYGI